MSRVASTARARRGPADPPLRSVIAERGKTVAWGDSTPPVPPAPDDVNPRPHAGRGAHVALSPGTRYASPPRPPGSNPLTRGDDMAQLKIPLDAQRFEKGMRWKDYMAQMGDTRARTEENYAKSKLTDDERKFFSGINQVRFVLMLAENWCGDVHRHSPLVAHICEAMPGADLRVFLRDQNVDLRDTFLT